MSIFTGSAATPETKYGQFYENFAAGAIPQDRLVRKEVALGLIREIVPPQNHIGLQLVPWLEVDSDDVTFNYLQGFTDGLAPARAEDAEAELAMKDDLWGGEGRASILDWSLKDHYRASDISRFRDALAMAAQLRDVAQLPRTVTSILDGWAAKIANDDARRRRKLDNRLEWLIMTGLSNGAIQYNDGKIKFSVDFGRPSGQTITAGNKWDFSGTTHDPIGKIIQIQQFMYDTYGVRITRALCSRRILNSFMNSSNFIARSGFVVGGTPSTPINPNYVMDGWGPNAAVEIVSRATNVEFIEYDSVYRTRAMGSTTVTTNRFFPDDRILFLPDEQDIAEFDDTPLGFGKVLTSPHPEGNWAPGFYEWETEKRDPWGQDRGTGVKAFPILPHMDLTVAVDIILPSAVTLP